MSRRSVCQLFRVLLFQLDLPVDAGGLVLSTTNTRKRNAMTRETIKPAIKPANETSRLHGWINAKNDNSPAELVCAHKINDVIVARKSSRVCRA